MKTGLLLLSTILVGGAAWARPASNGNRLSVSQGISSPASTSPVNYSSGFTATNPSVASRLTGPQISIEYDKGDDDAGNDSSAVGAELGLGNGQVGAVLGYYDRDCTNCDGRWGGMIGVNTGSFSFGVGYREEKHYSLGALFGGNGNHRFGLTADLTEEDSGNDVTAYGAGYSYLGGSWVFAVDASKRDQKGSVSNDVVLVTPGLMIQADWLAVSVSYDVYTNDKDDVFDDEVWFGVGIGGDKAHLAIYHDYVNDWALVGTFSF
ncbi:MAG TPA: hypothetical protein PL182_08815 [Pseudobdellovibrionaceae bacterium]|nr:hypothetical protein [Pseudobdellovibrionaceae bacterium]